MRLGRVLRVRRCRRRRLVGPIVRLLRVQVRRKGRETGRRVGVRAAVGERPRGGRGRAVRRGRVRRRGRRRDVLRLQVRVEVRGLVGKGLASGGERAGRVRGLELGEPGAVVGRLREQKGQSLLGQHEERTEDAQDAAAIAQLRAREPKRTRAEESAPATAARSAAAPSLAGRRSAAAATGRARGRTSAVEARAAATSRRTLLGRRRRSRRRSTTPSAGSAACRSAASWSPSATSTSSWTP